MASGIFARPGVVYAASEGQRFNVDTALRVVDCPTCHVTYAIPESFYKAARTHNARVEPRNHWTVCCPFGHSWHYTGLSEEQRLRERLDAERAHAGRLASERDQAQASARAEKAAKTRFRNQRDRERKRVAAGVCPVCNRTFKALARHMQGQHPDFPHDHMQGQHPDFTEPGQD